MSNSHYHKVANSGITSRFGASSGKLIERWKLLVKQSRKYANRTKAYGDLPTQDLTNRRIKTT